MQNKLKSSLIIALSLLCLTNFEIKAQYKEQQDQTVGTFLEILTIPTDGSTKTTSLPLESGVFHTIRVTGTWVWGGCDSIYCPEGGPDYLRWGDAGYLTDDHWNSYSKAGIYLKLNGNYVDVGPYNPSHIYHIPVIGSGEKIDFSINDCPDCFVDNAGSLRVELFRGYESEASSLNVKHFQQRSMLPDNKPEKGDWGSEPYGEPGFDNSATIEEWGCYLTSWAMAIDAWGSEYDFHTNPYELNKWLRENDGYVGRYVIPSKVAEYVREKTNIHYVNWRHYGLDNALLSQKIRDGIPVILQVGGHFVLATGETVKNIDDKTYYVNDPLFRSKYDLLPTLDSYSNYYTRIEYGLPVYGPDFDFSSISFFLASPAELMIIDQENRRTGIDPTSGQVYNEIPDAYYEKVSIESGLTPGFFSPEIKEFFLITPEVGNYSINVTGTGEGEFHLTALTYNINGRATYNFTLVGNTAIGEIDTYNFIFNTEPNEYTGFDLEFLYLPLVAK